MFAAIAILCLFGAVLSYAAVANATGIIYEAKAVFLFVASVVCWLSAVGIAVNSYMNLLP